MALKNSLLHELTGESPHNQDELGGCVHCGGHPPGDRYGYAERYLTDHDPRCPWVRARHLLGDKLPTSREDAFAFLRDQLPMPAKAARLLRKPARALLRLLQDNCLTELRSGAVHPSEEGLLWLARPKELRVTVLSLEDGRKAMVSLAGVPTLADLAPDNEKWQAASVTAGDVLFVCARPNKGWACANAYC